MVPNNKHTILESIILGVLILIVFGLLMYPFFDSADSQPIHIKTSIYTIVYDRIAIDK
jgi:hypothetical protein